MRAGTFIVGAATVAVLGYITFRLSDLDRRISYLQAQVNGSESKEPPPAAPAVATGTAQAAPKHAPSPRRGYEARIASLEAELHALRAKLDKRDGSGESRLKKEEEILSVVDRENARIRDVQLEWQRARWHEAREAALIRFARDTKLTPQKTAALHKALDDEVDALVEVLRRPDVLEDPDQTASDWQAQLEKTDHVARSILSPAELTSWNQARAFERKLFWPWLPDRSLDAERNAK